MLIRCCHKENPSQAAVVLETGCDLNDCSSDGWTPLTLLCNKGNATMARLVLERGADANKMDGFGETPLWLACKTKRLDLIRLLVEHGADVNMPDGYASTPLYIACERGDVDVVRLLLEQGADANQADGSDTPLLAACSDGYWEVALLLLEHGADPDACADESSTSPLSVACRKGSLDMVRLLLAHGANIHRLDPNGLSVCHAVCSHEPDDRPERPDSSQAADTLRLVLEHGLDVLATSEDGHTPLSLAVQRRHPPLIRLLRSHVLRNRIFTHPHTDSVPNRNQFGRHTVSKRDFLMYGVQHPLSKWEVREFMDVRGCVRNGVLGLEKKYRLRTTTHTDDKRTGKVITNGREPMEEEAQRILLFWENF